MMLTEIFSVAFLVAVPIWLVIEEVLHRSRIRAKAARLPEVRRPGRRAVAPDRLTHAAWPPALWAKPALDARLQRGSAAPQLQSAMR